MGCGQSTVSKQEADLPIVPQPSDTKATTTDSTATAASPTPTTVESTPVTVTATAPSEPVVPASTTATADSSASSSTAPDTTVATTVAPTPVVTSDATTPAAVPFASAPAPAPVPAVDSAHRPSTIARHLDDAAQLEHTLRMSSSASPPALEAVSEQPAWKSFTPEQLAAIEEARAAVRAKGPLVMDPKGTYGLICRACTKPNSTNVTFCTGCSFPSTVEDIQRLPDNIFLLLVQGQDIGAKVRYRDEESIVFDDKFPVSDNHLDVIPTAVYADVTVLTKEHVPMLERLYELGKKEFLSRNIPWLPKDVDIDTFITSGYNFPVSVKHLHLHMVLAPFKHEKVFQYPRWHSHAKVVKDLKEHGRVRLYNEHPNDEEGNAEYQRAMKNSEQAKSLVEAAKPVTPVAAEATAQ